MKDERYWAERFVQLEASQHDSSEKLVEEIQRQMRRAEMEIGRKIDAWYGRLMANNGVSMAEARRLLNDKELEEFRWDVNDYIRHGQENARNQKWMKQLENASARVHISRLEQLRLQVQQEAERLYGNYLDRVDRHMKSLYEEGFYKTAYEIQKGIGVGWNLSGIDSDRLEKIIRKPWAADGKNFSERIWSSKQQLIENVHTSLTQMCILGQPPDRAIDSVAKAMRTSRNQAGRLIMTESAFFGSEARKDSFRELGVEQYEIVATLDSSTSEICREMDGRVFPMSEYAAGATAPPFHVWCRTTTVPAFGDEFDHISERAARDSETGKTCYVPADMSYSEWKEKYVKSPVAGKDSRRYNDKKMKISFPDDISTIKGMTLQVMTELNAALDTLNKEYDIRLHSITVESAGKGDRFVVGWYDGKMGMIINQDADFDRIVRQIPKEYESGYFAEKSLEDCIAHEMFHVMVYQDCESESAYRARYEQVEALYRHLKGISGYADKTESGNEALAEAFVRIRNDENVPLIAKILVETYVGKWKK